MSELVHGYYNDDEFTELLSDAEGNAKNEWEEEFVDSLRMKYNQYGAGMYLSDKQVEILERIANGE